MMILMQYVIHMIQNIKTVGLYAEIRIQAKSQECINQRMEKTLNYLFG